MGEPAPAPAGFGHSSGGAGTGAVASVPGAAPGTSHDRHRPRRLRCRLSRHGGRPPAGPLGRPHRRRGPGCDQPRPRRRHGRPGRAPGHRLSDADRPLRPDGPLGPVRCLRLLHVVRRPARRHARPAAGPGNRYRRRALGGARQRCRGLRHDAHAGHRPDLGRARRPTVHTGAGRRRECRVGRDRHRQPAEHPDRQRRRPRFLDLRRRLRVAGTRLPGDRLRRRRHRLARPAAGRRAGWACRGGDARARSWRYRQGAGGDPGPARSVRHAPAAHRGCAGRGGRTPGQPQARDAPAVRLYRLAPARALRRPLRGHGKPDRDRAAGGPARPDGRSGLAPGQPRGAGPARRRRRQHHWQRAAGRPAARHRGRTVAGVPLCPGAGFDPRRHSFLDRQPRQYHRRGAGGRVGPQDRLSRTRPGRGPDRRPLAGLALLWLAWRLGS